MSLGFFNGNQEAAYRETSAKPGIVMPKSKLCPGCKTPRSPGQFTEGRKTCKKCRGVK